MRVFLVLSTLMILFGNMPFLTVNAQECLPTRLEIGNAAQVTPGVANRIHAQSNTNSEQVGQIPAGEVIMLLEGPQCMDNFLWWRINYDGTEGWTVEANATTYFLEPYTDVTATTSTNSENCNIATRLQVDGYGQVSSTIPSRLRNEPTTRGEQIGQVDPLDIFQVIDGPICADGFNWWQVEVNNLVGWLAEGDADRYYVEVVTDPVLIGLTSTPDSTLTSYAASWNADGTRLAIATTNGIFIYNPTDWLQEPYLLDNGILADDLAFSPTNPNLLVINGTNTLFRFRVYLISDSDESIIFELALMDGPMGGERPAHDFAFSRDGSQLGFGGTSYDIFETDTWTLQNHLEINELAGNHYARIRILPSDLSVNGDYGAGAIDGGIIHLFDFTTPHTSNFATDDPRISTLDRGGRTQQISAIQFSPDGSQLITGDITGSLQMWDLQTDSRTSFIRADNQTSISNRINDIAFHPDGETVATAESDPVGVVRIFDTETLETMTVFSADEAHSKASIVSYSPDGTRLLTVLDDVIYILNTTNDTVISQIVITQPE